MTTVKRLSLSMSTRANKNSMTMALRRTQHTNTSCLRKFSTNNFIRILYFNIYCQSHIENLIYYRRIKNQWMTQARMFIHFRSAQHVSGNPLPIFRGVRQIFTAYGILQRWIYKNLCSFLCDMSY